MSSDQVSRIRAIKNALEASPSCSGTWPVDASDTTLYYSDAGGAARWIDLLHAQTDEANQLVSACKPASFGRNGEEVMDESYRKAGKLDTDSFLTKFDPIKCGIIQAVCDQLSQGRMDLNEVETEVYKLNVYGEGSFFKAHRDTPRSERMFGSLVVVFPVPHQGGSLVIRHQSREWSFDSDAALKDQSIPKVGYTAFYSDVEHEVKPVTSGHRVTIAYNLLQAAQPQPQQRDSEMKETGDKATLEEALRVIRDPSFFPNGTLLGFGLAYKYPTSMIDGLRGLQNLDQFQLKGIDALLFDTSKNFNLNPRLYVMYELSSGENILCTRLVDFNPDAEAWYEAKLSTQLIKEGTGFRITKPQLNDRSSDESDNESGEREITWVIPLTAYNSLSAPYVGYEDTASLDSVEYNLCLVIPIEAAEARTVNGVIPEDAAHTWLESLPAGERARHLETML